MQNGVRFATSEEERNAVFSLRYDIYVTEMGRFKDSADHECKMLRDEYDDAARSVLAIEGGVPAGTFRLHWGADAPFTDELREAYALDLFADVVRDDQVCIAERLMVPQYLRGNQELTSSIYFFLYRFVVNNGIELIFLDCEPHLVNNWLRLGFRPFAPTFTYPGVGLVIPLVGVVWDIEHLRRVGSPLLMALGSQSQDERRASIAKQVLQRLPKQVRRLGTPLVARVVKTPHEAAAHASIVEKVRALLPESPPLLSERFSGGSDVLAQVYESLTLALKERPGIFDGMTDQEASRCIRSSNVIDCRKGDIIIQRGNAARTLFILLSGAAEVRRGEDVLAIFTAGEVFGEIAFLLGKPRTADVLAATDGVRVLSLSESAIRELMEHDERLSAKLLLNLCRCLCARMIRD